MEFIRVPPFRSDPENKVVGGQVSREVFARFVASRVWIERTFSFEI